MEPAVEKKLRVACITCYGDPDYIRSRTLRTALAADPEVETVVIKNTSKGAKRYGEVLWRMLRCRFQDKPDVYLLNFRGYELLPFVLLVAGRRPVIFDEFVNPLLVVAEHRQNKRGIVRWLMGAWSAFGWVYRQMAGRCYAILTDTQAHADYSAKLVGLERAKYHALPVGADETMFRPADTEKKRPFQVFFYSTGSQPLHGMPIIMEAAVRLSERSDIEFLIAGTKGNIAGQVAEAKKRGARIVHRAWIDFADFPNVIRQSGLCLGGPFGGTQQARVVVTGKTYQFLACQAPVVIGRSPATADFIDRQNCLLVDQADPEALAAAIVWSAEHPTELQEIAAAGRRLFEQKYSSPRIATGLSEIIAPLMPKV